MNLTKPKKRDYQIQYKDNTYRVVSWTKPEFLEVANDMRADFSHSVVGEDIFELKDIRAIVLLPELKEEKPQDGKENKLTEWGFVDPETAVYLKEVMGIDIGEVEQ